MIESIVEWLIEKLGLAYKALKIRWLKRKARLAFYRYERELDKLSCGNSLSEHVSPDVAEAKREVNTTLDRLQKLDPENAPTFRL